jgi:hypothetical protein
MKKARMSIRTGSVAAPKLCDVQINHCFISQCPDSPTECDTVQSPVTMTLCKELTWVALLGLACRKYYRSALGVGRLQAAIEGTLFCVACYKLNSSVALLQYSQYTMALSHTGKHWVIRSYGHATVCYVWMSVSHVLRRRDDNVARITLPQLACCMTPRLCTVLAVSCPHNTIHTHSHMQVT